MVLVCAVPADSPLVARRSSSASMVLSLMAPSSNKLPEGLIEKRPDSHLLIHLGSIEQVKSVFDAIVVNDLYVIGDGLEVEGALKSEH